MRPGGSGVSPGYESGLPGVTLDDREHVCVFYRGAAERDDVLAAFFGAGYAAGDKCLCIADDHDPAAVAERLDPRHKRGPDQLTVLPAGAYLTDGRFQPDQAFARWDGLVGGYVSGGYGRVRASGELSWFLRSGEASGPLLEYEDLCNRLVARRPATIFCLYDLDLLDAGLLPGVLARHPAALARGLLFRGPWRIEDRPGGANDALLLANQLLAGARTAAEVDGLLDGLRRSVVTRPDGDGGTGAEGRRFLLALDGLAAPHRRSAEADVAELARRLFEGRPLDAADEDRARALGVDLAQPVRAVAVRTTAAGGGAGPRLAASGVRLFHARPDEVAFLAADGAAFDWIAGPGRVVGVGRAHRGDGGAARSYAEARRAADFAAALDRPVLRHDDLGLFSLLADGGDPAAMAALVEEWLGPLSAHDDGRRPRQQLLPTLAAYLDAGGAQQATADALGVHVSTLKYRLGRLGEILGRDLGRPETRFQLQVALSAHRTLTVLRTQGD